MYLSNQHKEIYYFSDFCTSFIKKIYRKSINSKVFLGTICAPDFLEASNNENHAMVLICNTFSAVEF